MKWLYPLGFLIFGLWYVWGRQQGGEQFFLSAHQVLGLFTFFAFSTSGYYSLLLYLQDRRLKGKSQKILHARLPSLQEAEHTMFSWLVCGFVFLSIVLTSAFWSHANVPSPQRLPQLGFTGLAWAMYAGLIILRFKHGWRGKRAAIVTFSCMVILLILAVIIHLIGGQI